MNTRTEWDSLGPVEVPSNRHYGAQTQRSLENFKISGDYEVGRIHSTSISNEKKLINSLVENISKKILNEIEININDI